MLVRFETDAPAIHARWSLLSASLALPHMPATGVIGLHLYVRVGTKWRWLANGRPSAESNTMQVTGLADVPVRYRRFFFENAGGPSRKVVSREVVEKKWQLER